MLRLLKLMLALVDSTVGRLIEITNHLLILRMATSILHLMLFVSCCIIHLVMSLFGFVVLTVWGYVHIVAFLLELRPSFIGYKLILCVFFKEGLRCWCNLIVFALIQIWMLLLNFLAELHWVHIVSFSHILSTFDHWELILIRVTSEAMLLTHEIG